MYPAGLWACWDWVEDHRYGFEGTEISDRQHFHCNRKEKKKKATGSVEMSNHQIKPSGFDVEHRNEFKKTPSGFCDIIRSIISNHLWPGVHKRAVNKNEFRLIIFILVFHTADC